MPPSATPSPLRVALVTRDLVQGGCQRHIVKLCRTVSPAQARIALYLLIRDSPTDLLDQIPAHVAVRVSPYRAHHPRVVAWLAREIRGEGAQVVHSFLWAADATVCLARPWLSGVPTVCSERGDRGTGAYYSTARAAFDRLLTFRLADLMCANSDYGRRLLEHLGCDPRKVRVIPNGVDTDQIDRVGRAGLRALVGWPADVPVVGTVCRLTSYKGVDLLLRAIGLLAPRLPLRCAVVGDGPERPALERLAAELGVADRVAFLGMRRPAEAFLKEFDVAVLTTRAETEHCSNTLLEAMACERPVVATRVAGNPELVSDRVGVLVDPNDPSALAQAIGRLLVEPSLARDMGRRGRERVAERFTMVASASRFLSLWQGAAGAAS